MHRSRHIHEGQQSYNSGNDAVAADVRATIYMKWCAPGREADSSNTGAQCDLVGFGTYLVVGAIYQHLTMPRKSIPPDPRCLFIQSCPFGITVLACVAPNKKNYIPTFWLINTITDGSYHCLAPTPSRPSIPNTAIFAVPTCGGPQFQPPAQLEV